MDFRSVGVIASDRSDRLGEFVIPTPASSRFLDSDRLRAGESLLSVSPPLEAQAVRGRYQ